MHPLLDAAERVFDDLAAAVENRRPRFEALGHALENVLVFETKNRAGVVRASRAQLAGAAGFRVAVVDPFEIAQPAAADRRQKLPGRTDVGVEPGIVSELVLAKQALAHRGAALRLGDVRNAAGLRFDGALFVVQSIGGRFHHPAQQQVLRDEARTAGLSAESDETFPPPRFDAPDCSPGR